MNERDVGKMIGPLGRRLQNLLARGTVAMSNAARKMQTLQVKLLAGETLDALEHFEPYGFTSHPKPGAEVAALFVDGDRSHGIVLVVADRRYRLTSLVPGEVAIFDDQGQKVHITRSGIVVQAPTVTVKASAKVRIETPLLEVTGQIKDLCDVPAGKTMAAMRSSHNAHTHHENDLGGETSVPTQQI